MKKLAEILTGPEVWVKGSYHLEWSGKFCLMGAIWQTVEHPTDIGTLGDARGRAERIIGHHSVETWNDAPDRTWQEVAAVVEAYDRDRLLNP